MGGRSLKSIQTHNESSGGILFLLEEIMRASLFFLCIAFAILNGCAKQPEIKIQPTAEEFCRDVTDQNWHNKDFGTNSSKLVCEHLMNSFFIPTFPHTAIAPCISEGMTAISIIERSTKKMVIVKIYNPDQFDRLDPLVAASNRNKWKLAR